MPAAWADFSTGVLMQGEAIFWPVLLQAGLTYGIYAVGSKRRLAAVMAGEAKPGQFKIPGGGDEPERSATAMRNLINQFELPVLFYVCCLTLFVLNAAGTAAVLLAWSFALSRVLHAYVHVTTNRLKLRRPAFILGFFVQGAMWALLAWRLAAGA
jgi:hypothetical protein